MRKTLLKLCFTIAAFWLALHNVEWSELWGAYQQQNPVYLVVVCGVILAQNISGGLRWYCIRRALGEKLGNPLRTVVAYYASGFFTLISPSTIGADLARIWMLKAEGNHTSDVVSGVLIDRVMSLLGLAMLVVTTLPWLALYVPLPADWAVGLSFAGWVCMVVGYVLMHWLIRHIPWFGAHGWQKKMVAPLHRIANQSLPMAASLAFAMLAHVFYAVAGYMLARGLGIVVPWSACLVLMPLVLLLASLPISLGGWGVREAGMTTLLALAGVSNAAALALSIQLGVLYSLSCLSGGLLYLRRKSINIGDKW